MGREEAAKNFLSPGSRRSAGEILEWLIKLVLTVILSLTAGRLLGITDLLTLVFVTLLCIQPTTLGGLRTGFQQLSVAAVSSLFTLGLIQIVNNYYFTVSVSILLVSYYLIHSGKENLLAVAFFSVLYIGVLGRDKPESFFYERVEHLLVGIPVAAFLNYVFGVFQYRKKLMASIRRTRRSIFVKSGSILEGLASGGKESVERELNGLGDYYAQMDRIIGTLDDYQKEYRSFFSFLFVKIPDLRSYQLYIWSLHDLIQNIHSTAVLSFQMPFSEELSGHLLFFLGLFRDSAQTPVPADLDGLLEKYRKTCSESRDSIIMGHFFSTLIHLKAVQEYERTLPALNPAGMEGSRNR